MIENVQFSEKYYIGQNFKGGLNKDYKVTNLKNKDISVVCSPFTYIL